MEFEEQEKEEEEDEDTSKDPRHALYLDEKRMVVLVMVTFASFTNCLGYNCIQTNRRHVRLITDAHARSSSMSTLSRSTRCLTSGTP